MLELLLKDRGATEQPKLQTETSLSLRAAKDLSPFGAILCAAAFFRCRSTRPRSELQQGQQISKAPASAAQRIGFQVQDIDTDVYTNVYVYRFQYRYRYRYRDTGIDLDSELATRQQTLGSYVRDAASRNTQCWANSACAADTAILEYIEP